MIGLTSDVELRMRLLLLITRKREECGLISVRIAELLRLVFSTVCKRINNKRFDQTTLAQEQKYLRYPVMFRAFESNQQKILKINLFPRAFSMIWGWGGIKNNKNNNALASS